MPIAGPSRAGPSVPPVEALTLSASLFASSIDSWIPVNFGAPRPAASTRDEISLSSRDERSDRLGLGHPLIDQPRKGAPKGAGLSGLSRKLDSERKGKGKARDEGVSAGDPSRETDSEEEESRVRSVGRKKAGGGGLGDMFGGKKKKSKDPFAASSTTKATSAAIPHPQAYGNSEEKDGPSASDGSSRNGGKTNDSPQRSLTSARTKPLLMPTGASSPGDSGGFPHNGPRPFGSPRASREQPRGLKRGMSDDDGSEEEGPAGELPPSADKTANRGVGSQTGLDSDCMDAPGETVAGAGVKSKTQLRREKRKRAKLSKA
ncbi:hypothetical protein IAU60_002409 [Kwoniella sp. DSM 27419]